MQQMNNLISALVQMYFGSMSHDALAIEDTGSWDLCATHVWVRAHGTLRERQTNWKKKQYVVEDVLFKLLPATGVFQPATPLSYFHCAQLFVTRMHTQSMRLHALT